MKRAELLKQSVQDAAGPLVARAGRLKTAFTVSSVLWCAVHWVTNHSFSVYVFAAALIFGGLVASAVGWLSSRS